MHKLTRHAQKHSKRRKTEQATSLQHHFLPTNLPSQLPPDLEDYVDIPEAVEASGPAAAPEIQVRAAAKRYVNSVSGHFILLRVARLITFPGPTPQVLDSLLQ
jgi:hypothetical protein